MGQDAALAVRSGRADDVLGVGLDARRQRLTELGHEGRRDPREDHIGDPRREGLDEPVGDPLAHQRGNLVARGRRELDEPLAQVLDIVAQ